MSEKYKRIIIILVIIISIITLFFVAYLLFKDYSEYDSNNQDIEDLIDEVFIEDIETKESSIDWEYLKSVNEDIIGWLEIEGTEINYPILKDSSNLYYLKHNYLKKYNSNGSIFTLDSNPINSEETLIYGHNMRNGTMFSLLGNYLNRDFLFSHQKVKIYMSDVNYEGLIFSAYSIGIGKEKNNISDLSFEKRVNYYQKASQVKVDNVEISDKIIKLSTCSYINAKTRPTDQRYYIIATLEKITKEGR